MTDYDEYGFPKQNKINNRKTNVVKWLKVLFWLSLVGLIIFKLMTMGLSAYLSYYDFKNEINTILRIIKMALSIIFSEIYLIYKLLVHFSMI